MMIRRFSTTGTLLILTLLPLTAQAYVTPEEALNESDFTTNFYDPPPSTRSADERAAEQQRLSAERRDAELDALKPKTAEEEVTHEAAPEAEKTDLDKMIELMKLMQTQQQPSAQPADDTDARAGLDPATQRLLIRAEAQRNAAERAALIQSLVGDDGELLHSGAPLADTGPATVLISVAVLGAIAETWRRVRKSEVHA